MKDGHSKPMVPTSERSVQLAFLKNLSVADQAKQWKPIVWKFETLKNFVDEHFEPVFPFQLHLSFHGYPQFSQMNSTLYL